MQLVVEDIPLESRILQHKVSKESLSAYSSPSTSAFLSHSHTPRSRLYLRSSWVRFPSSDSSHTVQANSSATRLSLSSHKYFLHLRRRRDRWTCLSTRFYAQSAAFAAMVWRGPGCRHARTGLAACGTGTRVVKQASNEKRPGVKCRALRVTRISHQDGGLEGETETKRSGKGERARRAEDAPDSSSNWMDGSQTGKVIA